MATFSPPHRFFQALHRPQAPSRYRTLASPASCGLIVLLLGALYGCGGGSENPVPTPGFGTVSRIEIQPSSSSIVLGSQQRFGAFAFDASDQPITGVGFTWTSDNTIVAVVDNEGVAIGQAVGTARITATSGSISATATLTVTASPTEGPGSPFAAPVRHVVGVSPIDLAVRDLDQDGHEDAAVANFDSNNVIITYGDLTSSSPDSRLLRTGPKPVAIVAADLDGDSDLDLITANLGDAAPSFSVFIQGPPRLFTPQHPAMKRAGGLLPNPFPFDLVAADLNQDGRIDLAVSDLANGLVLVYPGNGDGTFGAAIENTVLGISSPSTLLTADFNQDTVPDLAFVSPTDDAWVVLLNKADMTGTFDIGSIVTKAGTRPVRLATADFDGSGTIDLAVVNQGDETLSVYLGNGDGSFIEQTPITINLGGNPQPEAIAAGLFDADNNIDLAIVNKSTQNITLLFGRGDGGFDLSSDPDRPPTRSSPSAIVATDLDSDGHDDLLVTNRGDNSLQVFMNTTP